MNYCFNMQLVDGNPVIEHNGKHFLVDTGNPMTIANGEVKDFCGRDWHAVPSFMGADLAALSEMVGMQLDAMIGLDVMKNFIVTFDYNNGNVTFSTPDESVDGQSSVPVNVSGMTGVTTEIDINGQTGLCIFDTGARVSYLVGDIPENAVWVGRQSDYHPLAEHFETDVYEMQASIAGTPFTMRFGKLPQMLEMALGLARVRCIVGCDLLSQHRVIVDFTRRRMMLA